MGLYCLNVRNFATGKHTAKGVMCELEVFEANESDGASSAHSCAAMEGERDGRTVIR